MEMRAGHPPGRTYQADPLARGDVLTQFHVDRRQMRQQREQSDPMIDDDRVAAEIQIARQRDAAGVWRHNRRAFGPGEIFTGMTVARLAVEDTERAEPAAGTSPHRRNEAPTP